MSSASTGVPSDRLRSEIRQVDTNAARLRTHSLKGVSATLGAKELNEAFRTLETALKTKKMDRLPELMVPVTEGWEPAP